MSACVRIGHGRAPNIALIARTSNGAESAAAIHSRRVMSRSSGFAGASLVIVLGSSAMPQIGQAPGSFRTTSGCIGQVHSTGECSGEGWVLGAKCSVRCWVLGAGACAGACLRTSGTVLVACMPRGPRASQPAGSLANFSRQPGLQK